MREKMKGFVHSNAILSAFLLCVLFISAVTIFGILLLDMIPPIRLTIFTIGQLVLSGILIWLMRKLEVFDVNEFRFRGIVEKLPLAWFGIVYIIVSFFVVFTQIPADSYISPNISYLLIVILHPFIGTGIFEEVLYRGLVLKILLNKMGDSKKGTIHSIIISSALFGFFHVGNIFAGAPVMSTITQMISATATGLFFAVIFVRTRKLLIPILLHGLLNLSVQIFDAIVSPAALALGAGSQAEINIIGFIVNTLFETLPILIAGLILLRKVKPAESET